MHIQLDYRFDTLGFFSDPVRRTAMEQAVASFAPLGNGTPEIIPGGGNTWSWTLQNPSTGEIHTIDNPSVSPSTLVFYVLAAPLVGLSASSEADIDATGSEDWLNAIDAGENAIGPWGGFITFDSLTNWSFAGSAPPSDKIDFRSVAEHETGHLLGFSSGIEAFDRLVSGGPSDRQFVGPSVVELMGGPVPLSFDGSHFAQATRFEGRMPTMLPSIAAGEVQRTTLLDLAALKDIGYAVDLLSVPEPSTWALIGLGASCGLILFRRRAVKSR